jgi:hypothetical protein
VYKIWSIIAVDVRGIPRFKQMEGLLEGHGFSFKSAKSQEAKSTNDSVAGSASASSVLVRSLTESVAELVFARIYLSKWHQSYSTFTKNDTLPKYYTKITQSILELQKIFKATYRYII